MQVSACGNDAINSLIMLWCVEDKPTKTLIVKNLPFTVVKESLQEVFENSIRIGLPMHQDTGKLKG